MTMSKMCNPRDSQWEGLPLTGPWAVKNTFIDGNWLDEETFKRELRRCVSDPNLKLSALPPIFGHVSEADVELPDLAVAAEDPFKDDDSVGGAEALTQRIFTVLKRSQCKCKITVVTSKGENARYSRFGPGQMYDLSKDTGLGELAAFLAENYDILVENRRCNQSSNNNNNFNIFLIRHDEANPVWSDRSYECCTTITTKGKGKKETMKARCRCNDDVTSTWSLGEVKCVHRRFPDLGSWSLQRLRKDFDLEEIHKRSLEDLLAALGMLNDEKVAAVSMEDKFNCCYVRVYPTEKLDRHREQLKSDCPFHADALAAEESWIRNGDGVKRFEDSMKLKEAKADVKKKGTSPAAGLKAEAPDDLSAGDLLATAEPKKKCTSLASSALPANWGPGAAGAAWADVDDDFDESDKA